MLGAPNAPVIKKVPWKAARFNSAASIAKAGMPPGNCWLRERAISMPRWRQRATHSLRERRALAGRRASWKLSRAAPDRSQRPVEAPGARRCNAFLPSQKRRAAQAGPLRHEQDTDEIRSHRCRILRLARSLDRFHESNNPQRAQSPPCGARPDPRGDGRVDGYARRQDCVADVAAGGHESRDRRNDQT